jgi:CBS domain-containing protein
MFTAKEIMTTDVVTITPDDTIGDAVDRFERYQISGLPVVDDRWQVLGVLTEYDLLRGITTLRMCGKVADFMTADTVCVEEDATLAELAELFLAARVRRVPVTRSGRLIGVISRRDLIFAANVRQELVDLPLVSALATEV